MIDVIVLIDILIYQTTQKKKEVSQIRVTNFQLNTKSKTST